LTARGPQVARLPRLAAGAGPPRIVPLGRRLGLVAADVPRRAFDAGALDSRLKDTAWVAKTADAHHRAVDRLARSHAVVPLRLFTLFTSDVRAQQSLGRSAARLASALARVRDRSEWVVRVFRPARLPKASITRERPASGTAFLRERASMRDAERERARALAAGVQALTAGLGEVADDHVDRPVAAGGGALVDAAFLVGSHHVPAFRRKLSALSRDLRQRGCRVSLTGPWPPYSFVNLGGRDRG
jgi:hypothetical protein